MDRSWHVAVVGATGVVGRELVGALALSGHPADRVRLLASERSAGEELSFGEGTLEVEMASADTLRGAQGRPPRHPGRRLAHPGPGGRGRRGAGGGHEPGLRVGPPDAGGLSRVCPGQGSGACRARAGSGCPGPVSQALLCCLEPLRAAAGLREVHCSALISSSAAGRDGVSELEQQTAALLSSRELEAVHFPHRLGFNLVPQVGPFSEGSGSTLEELSWRAETGLLWGRAAPALDGTAVWVPDVLRRLSC